MTCRHKLLVIALVSVAALWLSACGNPPAEPAGSANREPVVVQLSWIHTVEFAGFYMAEEQGYYSEENLAVELRSGGLDADGNIINAIDEVTSGRADFGVFDGSSLVMAVNNGVPVVAIAAIYQRSPVAFVSLAEKGIVAPQDLVGATVALDVASSGPLFSTLLNTQHVDPNQVRVVQRTDFSIAPLVNGEVDVIDGWVTNEVVALELEGHESNLILPSDYGLDVYPNLIFTTKDMVTNNPDLVERFLRATLRGMRSAIDDPDTAAALVLNYNSERILEVETAAMQRSLPLLAPAGSQPGMMRADVWYVTYRLLADQGLIERSMDINQVYTMKFLDSIYGG
jgi:NitT/TauT family transport system substrate-binding protein